MIVIVGGNGTFEIPVAVFVAAFAIVGIGILIGILYSFVPAVRDFIRSVKW